MNHSLAVKVKKKKDFEPVIEVLKSIGDELPKYTKLFIQTRVGFKEKQNIKAIWGD
jgi:hypothetical protein